MDPFRGYLKVKIKEGRLAAFQSLLPSYTEAVRDSEPQALQFEAFANNLTNEIIFLESYANNTGFDAHLTNDALREWKHEMMGLQEQIIDMYFMSAPTTAALEALLQYNIQPTILDPWPGTIRLTEERNEKTNIQTFVTIDLEDLDAYRTISKQVEYAALSQAGVLFHRSYQIDDVRVAVLEEYTDSQTFMEWAEIFAENAGDFGNLIKKLTCEVCGSPSGPCKELLDGWGAVYFEKIAGFIRFK